MLKDFFKSFVIYGLSPVLGKFIGLFLVPIYTRIFSPEEFGVIDIFTTIAQFIEILVTMEIFSGVGRYYFDQNKKFRSDLISTGLILQLINTFIIFSLLLVLKDNINIYFFGSIKYLHIYYLILVWVSISGIFAYFSVLMRYEKKPIFFLIVTNTQLFLKLFVVILLVVVLSYGIVGIFWGYITGTFFGTLLLLSYFRRYIKLVFNKKFFHNIVRFSIPLVPAVIIWKTRDLYTRVFIVDNLQLEDVGYFSLALRIVSILAIIGYALKMIWGPFIFEKLSDKKYKKDILKLYRVILIMVASFVVILSLFSSELVNLFAPKEYATSANLVGFLAIFSMFGIMLQIVGIGPQISKKTYWITFQRLFGFIILMVLFYILVPKYGIIGVAISYAIAEFANFIFALIVTERQISVAFPRVFSLAIILIVTLGNLVFLSFKIIFIYKLLILMFLLLLITYNFHSELSILFKSLFNKKGIEIEEK